MILYRIYQFIFMIPVLLVLTIITAIIVILLSLIGLSGRPAYYVSQAWARIFCLLTFVRVTVSGRENVEKNTSYVFVANHQGAYDIFSIYGYLGHNFKWMMKKSLEKIPFVGFSCKMSGQIFVDNSSPAAIRRTMETAEKRLSKGMSVVVFPEGARTMTGQTGRFKRGAFILAEEFRLPVVPITIDGAFKVLPRTATLPRPGRIRLTIHKPIVPGPDGHDIQAVLEQSREAILSAL